MFVNQVTIFLENREGRLENLFKILFDNNVAVKSFSLADTAEYGIVRMIVDDYEKAVELLKKEGYSAKLNEVLDVKAKKGLSSVYDILAKLSKELNVEYIYVCNNVPGEESVIVKTNDNKRAYEILFG